MGYKQTELPTKDTVKMSGSALGPVSTGTFPFGKLPPEIRNKIYKYLIIIPLTTIEIGPKPQNAHSREGYQDVVHAISHLQSLKLNRAVYSEASSLFYGSREFQFYFPDSVHQIEAFFHKMTPSSRLSIRKLDLHLSLEYMETSAWVATCSYLAERAALRELKLRLVVCGGSCKFECPSDSSDINSPWATALARIQGLSYFAIHTYTCGGKCGFGEDGIFAEDNVVDYEDDDAEKEKEALCRMFHSQMDWPCDCHSYVECGFECFKRDFVEGLRERMGLRTGQRFVHTLTGDQVGCYKDVDPKDVVVPAAGRVVGLSHYCRVVEEHEEDDSEEEEDDSEEEEGDSEEDEGHSEEDEEDDSEEEEDDSEEEEDDSEEEDEIDDGGEEEKAD